MLIVSCSRGASVLVHCKIQTIVQQVIAVCYLLYSRVATTNRENIHCACLTELQDTTVRLQ